MVTVKAKGDFSRTFNFFERIKSVAKSGLLDKYGAEGVKALEEATPKDTGTTAKSWYYKVTFEGSSATLAFCNSNIQNGIPIAIILQYGHGTGTGGWVQGRDYINPAIQPLFDKIAKEAWKEVARK